MRAGVIGAAFGGGLYLGLRAICGGYCGQSSDDARLPALSVGALVALLVYYMNPGDHWVQTPLSGWIRN